jgi:hypothetical protein
MATAKPMLASQIDNPDAEKTEVASLAEVLQRLAPEPPATSVRDAVPELVRPVVPDVSALRAALNLRDPAPAPAVADPAVETAPAFTELPSDPVTAPIEDVLVEPEDIVFEEPSAAEIQAALAEAIEAQRDPTDRAKPDAAPAVVEPTPPTKDSSEDEHDAFAYAIADAILPPRPYPQSTPVARATPVAADVPAVEPTPAPMAEAVAEPAPAPVAEAIVEPAPAAPQPKPKFKRAKPKKEAEAKKPVEAKRAEAKAPEAAPVSPAKDSEPHPAPVASTEDDELIRQIRVHREDMVDVDDQIARIDQEIAAEQQAMAHYVSVVEQKNAHRARLLRLRTNTQRFVETLQMKAEPVRRTKKEQKSA